MKKTILLIFVMAVVLSCYNREKIVDKTTLLGADYRLFQNTVVWELAKAVEDEDVPKIKYLVREKRLPVDFQEEIFGHTLLMMSIYREQKKSVKALLELGADPNKRDTYYGTSPIIIASWRIGFSSDDPYILKLLLQYGCNPNDEEVGERPKGNYTRRTPLGEACWHSLEKVKLLVEAGADVNHTNEYNTTGAIKYAFAANRMDIVLYLLEHGADYERPILISTKDGKPYYICDELLFCLYPLGSQKHKDKMKVKDFLLKHGVECCNSSIPDHLLKKIQEKYPDSWQEYIQKY
jgi:hypothetical protein